MRLLSRGFGENGTINAECERSVPARRLFELYFDGLARIGDFNPLAVGFPAFGDNLNQDFTEWRVRNVGNTFAIGLHVELDFLVFAEFSLFDVLEIDAGVFDGLVAIATHDFNANAIRLSSFRCRCGVCRRVVLRGCGEWKERGN